MGKQQTNDEDLFDNLDIADLENAMIEVDVPDDASEEKADSGIDISDKAPADGEAGKVKKSGDIPDKKPIETILVDTGTEDDEQTDDKDKKEKSELEKEGKKGGGTPQEETESPVILHAAALQEHGVLPNFDLKSLEGLKPEDAILKINNHIQSQINESIKEGVDEYKSTLGERAKEFIDNLEKGVPFDELADNYTLEQRYGSINPKALEDDEKLQEQIYADYLSMKGFSDAKISKYVESAKEKDSLYEESVDGLKEIHYAIEEERKELKLQADQEKKAKEENSRKIRETINTTINDTKEIIPGIELSDEDKKELIKMMTIPVNYVSNDGRKIPMSTAMATRAKNPLLFEMRLAYFVKNGFFDENIKKGAFDVFTKKVETTATKRLASIMNGEKRSTGTPPSQVEKDEEKKKSDFIFPQDLIKM